MTMPVAASVESLPAIVYRGQPVITTEFLAGMYGAPVENIQKNFRANKDRFAEGKHFFRVRGEELTNLQATLSTVQICSSKVRQLLLWTAKGSARHAKMLNTDSAWDVYERMEDGYFELLEQKAAQATAAPKPAPLDLPISTTADRAPLRALCAEWARKMAAPGPATQDHHKAASLQLKANFQLDAIKQLPLAWVPDAVAWVQDQINMLQTQTALPAPEPKQEQAMLPMPDSTEDVALCMNKLRMAKGIIMEESDRLFRIIKKRVSTRSGGHGPAAHSMLVNMNYASEEIAYGLDRQLNALERIAQAGLLTSEALPVRM